MSYGNHITLELPIKASQKDPIKAIPYNFQEFIICKPRRHTKV